MPKDEELLKSEYEKWRANARVTKEGFFPVFKNFRSYLKGSLSSEAIRVFLYLGLVSNNKSGEVFYPLSSIASYLDKTDEDLKDIMDELKAANLVERIKTEEGTKTFLLPY